MPFGIGGGGAVEQIGVELVAKTGKFLGQVDGAVNKAQGRVGKFGAMLGKAVVAGAAVGGVALVGLGAAAAKMGLDFEHSIAEVKTLLPDLSEEGFNKLKDDVLDLSKEMGIATSDMVPALYQAISAGVPKENVIDFLRVGAKASIGGVTDLATAVDGLTTVQNAFGYSADQTGRVADVMFTAVKLGKTTMAELSTSMFQAAPLAAALGLEIEDVAGATATLTKSGTPTSVAMTQVRQAMTALAKPTADMTKLLEKTGYESGEALLQAEGFAGALGILSEAADGNKEVLGKAFGSVEALQAVLGLTGENAEVAAADLAAMNDATGAADEAFTTMSSTLKFKINKAINAAKIEMTKFGIKVLPYVEKGLGYVGDALKEVSKLVGIFVGILTGDSKKIRESFDALPDSLKPVGEAVKDIARFVRFDLIPAFKDFVKAALPVVKEVGAVLLEIARGVLPIVIDAVKQLVEMWQSLYRNVLEPYVIPILKKVGEFLLDHKPILVGVAAAILLLTNPWLAVVAAIVLVLAKWDEIKAFFEDIGDTISDFVDDVIQKVSDFPIIGEIIKDTFRTAKVFIEAQIKAIKLIFKTALDTIINTFRFWKAVFTGDWDAAWNAVKAQFEVIVNLLAGIFGIALDLVVGMLSSKLEMVKGIGEDLGNLIVGAATKVWDDLKAEFGEAVGAVADWVTGAARTIAEIGTDVGNFVLDAAKAVWDTITDIFGGVKDALAKFVNRQIEGWTAIGTTVGNFVIAGATAVWDTINSVFGGIKDALERFVKRQVEGWTAIGTTVGNFVIAGATAVWDTITDVFGVVKEVLVEFVNRQIEGWKSIGATVGSAIMEGFGDGVRAAEGFVKGALNFLITLVERGINGVIGLINAIPSITLPFGGGTIGIPHIDPVSIDRLQHGGHLAAGQWAQVNERGTEFFQPYSSGMVLPIGPGGTGGGGSRLTNYGRIYNVYGPGRQSRDVLRDLDRMVP